MKNEVIYYDEVKSSPVITAVLVFAILIVVLIVVFSYQKGDLLVGSVSFWALGFFFFLNFFVLIFFSKMTISLSHKYLSFGFSFFKKNIVIADIKKVEESKFEFANYMGYGIRYGRDGTLGYVPSSGKGLKIKVENEKREIFFVCNFPEQIINLLEKYGSNKK